MAKSQVHKSQLVHKSEAAILTTRINCWLLMGLICHPPRPLQTPPDPRRLPHGTSPRQALLHGLLGLAQCRRLGGDPLGRSGIIRKNQGKPVENPWKTRGKPVENPWKTHGTWWVSCPESRWNMSFFKRWNMTGKAIKNDEPRMVW